MGRPHVVGFQEITSTLPAVGLPCGSPILGESVLKIVGTDEHGDVVLEMHIDKIRLHDKETIGEYRIVAAVAEPETTRYTSRSFPFPRLSGNYIGLLEAALLFLDDDFKDFQNGPVSPSDLARRLHRTLPALQGWARRLRHH